LGEITALRRVVLYEISQATLLPLLKATLGMAEELSELLTSRLRARQIVLDQPEDVPGPHANLAHRVAATIRHVFSLT
jgi:hypothetical protein